MITIKARGWQVKIDMASQRPYIGTGTMLGGKTAWQIIILNALEKRGMKVQAFNHPRDQRYGVGVIASHDGLKRDSLYIESPGATRQFLEGEGRNIEVVGFDEVEIYPMNLEALANDPFTEEDPRLVKQWLELFHDLAKEGRIVLISCLDFHYRGELWALPRELLNGDANITYLREANCAVCGAPATKPQRFKLVKDQKGQLKEALDSRDAPLVIIGGAKFTQDQDFAPRRYEPRCDKCFIVPT